MLPELHPIRAKYAQIISDHQLWLADKGGQRADLRDASLCFVNLSKVNLSKADLRGADFAYSNLFETNFSDADLREVRFSYSNVEYAFLGGANTEGANFHWTGRTTCKSTPPVLHSPFVEAPYSEPAGFRSTRRLQELQTIAGRKADYGNGPDYHSVDDIPRSWRRDS